MSSRLISFEEAGEMFGGLHPNTLRQRKAGTQDLTHVPVGRRLFLIRAEVEELIDLKIKQAQASERRRKLRVVRAGELNSRP